MGKSRCLDSASHSAILSVSFWEPLLELMLMLENWGEFSASFLKPLAFLELDLALFEWGHFRWWVHHSGHHSKVLHPDPFDFLLGTVITVEMVLLILEVIDFRIILLPLICIHQLHKQSMIWLPDFVINPVFDLSLT